MNIPKNILDKVGVNLHNKTNHPIQLVKKKIFDYFGESYAKFDNFAPKVSVEDNFDLLRITPDHAARKPTDTYYFDEKTVLRTHTSAHQVQLLRQGLRRFLVAGDVYRKDEVNCTHYPVFHQVEGLCLTDKENPEEQLKKVLSGLITALFPNKQYRFGDDTFPFTDPSFEIEVQFGDRWLEVLGCGVIHPEILKNGYVSGRGWAFGIGLERIAMLLYEIPDIRYFWVDNPRFLNQFNENCGKFIPYTLLDSTHRDISFWIPDNWQNENNFTSIVRDIAGNYVTEVRKIDEFTNKQGRQSRAYAITYEEIDPDVVDSAVFTQNVNTIHNKVLEAVKNQCPELTIR